MEPRRRFRFLKELSEGAFGKVYLAEMITGENFKSVVAIKLLHGKWLEHEEIVQRSRDEARVLGLLHHRNIIRVEDLTSINGQCAIVMEYLNGVDIKTLTVYCKEQKALFPRKVALEVTAQIASALEAAYWHKPLSGVEPLRLIHRDIKPSNVMLTTAGDVKVLDFGTAQARFDDREAHTQALAFGSAAYMAPERLLGDADAPSGDVFSMGVTLYEMLALESYGKVHIRPEKYDKVLAGRLDAINLSDVGEAHAEHLRGLLATLLAYEADERPTAPQVVEIVEALAEQIHDGSTRRFCREVVEPCKRSDAHAGSPDDPITGSTLFEDVSGMLDAGPNETWIDEGAAVRSPELEPPQGESSSTPFPTAQSEQSSAAVPVEPAAHSEVFATSVPQIEQIAPVADLPSPVQRPKPVVAPVADGGALTFETPGHDADVPEKKGGMLKFVVIGVLLLGLFGVGGVAVVALGLFAADDGSTETTTDPPPEAGEEVGSENAVKGGEIEIAPASAENGALALSIRARGAVLVTITSPIDRSFRQEWDGSEDLKLVGLNPGVYRTKIDRQGEASLRSTLDVAAGKTCSFSIDAKKDSAWSEDGCE